MPDPGQLVGPDTLFRPSDQPPPADLGFPSTSYTPPDGAGQFTYPDRASADQAGVAFYNQYLIDRTYVINPGVAQTPVAGPAGAPCEFPQVSAPWWSCEIQWTAERENDWPDVPGWVLSDDSHVFLGGRFRLCNPLDGPNGLLIYRVQGFYRYGLTAPPSPGADFPVASTPANTDGFVRFPSVRIVSGILDGGGLLRTS